MSSEIRINAAAIFESLNNSVTIGDYSEPEISTATNDIVFSGSMVVNPLSVSLLTYALAGELQAFSKMIVVSDKTGILGWSVDDGDNSSSIGMRPGVPFLFSTGTMTSTASDTVMLQERADQLELAIGDIAFYNATNEECLVEWIGLY